MQPDLFSIPTFFWKPIPVHAYGLMIAIAFLVALYGVKRDAGRAGYDPDAFGDLAFWVLLIGLIGTRITYILMFREEFSWSEPLRWFAVWEGGLVFQGAFPAAFITFYVYTRKKHIDFWKAVDLTCPYMPLAHAIGRLGCFLNGCCWGCRTELPWGIPFRRIPWDVTVPPSGSPPFLDHCRRFGLTITEHWSYPVHPTQLYEAGALFILAVVLYKLRNRYKPFDGYLLPLYFMAYAVFRFFNEILRGDSNPKHFPPLTDQQVLCIALLVFGAVLMYFLRRRGRRTLPATQH